MQKRYFIVILAGVALFAAVGVAGFYGGELMNAPKGVYVDHEDPVASR
ncbi:MAG TPA: hypothetical protein VGO22_15480 [Pseudorhizobium sp.]|jgi:hypothetical protein|nr:hypothetical protein [Pseudorhizobium sp.]